jgi:ADP-heptose:LPS heptosyltransferase
MMILMKKILVIRLSSFGDIVQCLAITKLIKFENPQAQITLLTKKQFAGLGLVNPEVSEVISFDRDQGLMGWIKLCRSLREEGYDVVYDAHSNIRTLILRLIFIGSGSFQFFKRSKSRFKRFLLFFLRMNLFPKPFRGMVSFQEPIQNLFRSRPKSILQNWDFSNVDKEKVQAMLPQSEKVLVCSPSAAWEMKRWPLDHWKSLFQSLNEYQIVLLGGPADTFYEEFISIAPERIINLAGKLSLIESCYVISQSKCFVSADTGLIHVAEILGIPGISIIGPTAFGFPTHEHIKTMEVPLSCRPCTKDGRGKCSQDIYKKCLVDITPEMIENEIKQIMK